jgi:hypothetical protein
LFGGGLGLYANGVRVGGLGVSDDTSCTDHTVGWRTRHALNLVNLAGVAGISGDSTHPDDIVYDITPNPCGGAGSA